jgi:hypothetical protein
VVVGQIIYHETAISEKSARNMIGLGRHFARASHFRNYSEVDIRSHGNF